MSHLSTAAAACGGFTAGRRAGRTYRSTAAGTQQQRRRSTALSSKCEQRHVYSRRRMLNTDSFLLLRPDRGAEYCDERVCLSVCLCVCLSVRDHIFGTSDLRQIFVHVTCGPASVILWRRNDTLCTSGFMDDVMFSHKPRLLDVAAQLKRSAHAALGLAINCAR